MRRSLEALLSSWSDELTARINRVRSLIGDAHWLTDGMHKERLLASFISGRLPSSVSAGHGFLVDPTLDLCSREIDVLVRDCLQSAPFLDESGITICHPKAVLAYIEVKSDITAATLESSLQMIYETQALVETSNDAAGVWRGICFTADSADRTDDSLLKTIGDKVSDVCDLDRAKSGQCINYLPICIICLEKFVLFIGPSSAGGRCRLRYFPTRRLSFSVGLTDMLSHVYSRAGVKSYQPLDEGVEQAVQVSPLIREV